MTRTLKLHKNQCTVTKTLFCVCASWKQWVLSRNETTADLNCNAWSCAMLKMTTLAFSPSFDAKIRFSSASNFLTRMFQAFKFENIYLLWDANNPWNGRSDFFLIADETLPLWPEIHPSAPHHLPRLFPHVLARVTCSPPFLSSFEQPTSQLTRCNVLFVTKSFVLREARNTVTFWNFQSFRKYSTLQDFLFLSTQMTSWRTKHCILSMETLAVQRKREMAANMSHGPTREKTVVEDGVGWRGVFLITNLL